MASTSAACFSWSNGVMTESVAADASLSGRRPCRGVPLSQLSKDSRDRALEAIQPLGPVRAERRDFTVGNGCRRLEQVAGHLERVVGASGDAHRISLEALAQEFAGLVRTRYTIFGAGRRSGSERWEVGHGRGAGGRDHSSGSAAARPRRPVLDYDRSMDMPWRDCSKPNARRGASGRPNPAVQRRYRLEPRGCLLPGRSTRRWVHPIPVPKAPR